jgi:hypothetical protein
VTSLMAGPPESPWQIERPTSNSCAPSGVLLGEIARPWASTGTPSLRKRVPMGDAVSLWPYPTDRTSSPSRAAERVRIGSGLTPRIGDASTTSAMSASQRYGPSGAMMALAVASGFCAKLGEAPV